MFYKDHSGSCVVDCWEARGETDGSPDEENDPLGGKRVFSKSLRDMNVSPKPSDSQCSEFLTVLTHFTQKATKTQKRKVTVSK